MSTIITQHIARTHHPHHTVRHQLIIGSQKYGISDARVNLLRTKILCFAELLILMAGIENGYSNEVSRFQLQNYTMLHYMEIFN